MSQSLTVPLTYQVQYARRNGKHVLQLQHGPGPFHLHIYGVLLLHWLRYRTGYLSVQLASGRSRGEIYRLEVTINRAVPHISRQGTIGIVERNFDKAVDVEEISYIGFSSYRILHNGQ